MAQADCELDILGQQLRVNRLYTQLTFCFGHADADNDILCSSLSGPLQILARAFKQLSENFKWITGRVICQDGSFKINCSPEEPASLTVKDLRNCPAFPSWQALKDAEFPFSMLDEAVVAPHNTLAASDPVFAELPVFPIQVNLIKGGLLLTINAQHGAMDMTAQSSIISLFAKACRGEEFSPEELKVGNMDRKSALSEFMTLHTNASGYSASVAPPSPYMDPLITQSIPRAVLTRGGDLCWCYFAFSLASLTELKSSASRSIPQGTFISTDDALSALTWQSITGARLPRLKDTSSSVSARYTTLSRNVDMRYLMGLPPTYPGFITSSTTHTASVDALVEQPVGEIAHQLRIALEPQSLITHFLTQLAAIRCEYGGGSINNGTDKGNEEKPSSRQTISDPDSLDVRLSSWAKEKCYLFDFGTGLGKPVAVRRPKFTAGARAGLVYFLPKGSDGEIVVGVCLGKVDMERLMQQPCERTRYGRWIG